MSNLSASIDEPNVENTAVPSQCAVGDAKEHLGLAKRCSTCGFDFAFMKVHIRVAHKGLAEISCAFCGLPFESKADLFAHLVRHEDRQLSCCICKETFINDDALDNHLESHRELHVLYCSICSRTFASKASKLAHTCLAASASNHEHDLPCDIAASPSAFSIDGNPVALHTDERITNKIESLAVHPVAVEASSSELCPTIRKECSSFESEERLQLSSNGLPESTVKTSEGRSNDNAVENVNSVPTYNVISREDSDAAYAQHETCGRSSEIENTTNPSLSSDQNTLAQDCVRILRKRSFAQRQLTLPELLKNSRNASAKMTLDLAQVPNCRSESLAMPEIKLEISDAMSLNDVVNDDLVVKEEPLLHEANAVPNGTTEDINLPVQSSTVARKRISFNEQTEIWLWEQQVKAYGELSEAGQSASLVDNDGDQNCDSYPAKKRRRKSPKSPSKSKKKGKRAKIVFEKPLQDPLADELLTIEQPTIKIESNHTEKPSDDDKSEENSQENKPGNRFKNRLKLEALFGKGFRYSQCVKIDGRYHCPDENCSDNNHRGYMSEKMIRNHIRLRHMIEECHRCTICDRAFPTKSKVGEHMVTHRNDRPFHCTECECSFKTEIAMRAHRMRHFCPWQCYHCKSTFARKVTLKDHMRGSNCTSCDIFFHCSVSFRQHEQDVKHTYSCPICNKKSTKMARFLHHVRSAHYNETTAVDGKFVCHLCDRKFTSKYNAHRHVRRSHVVAFKSKKRLTCAPQEDST